MQNIHSKFREMYNIFCYISYRLEWIYEKLYSLHNRSFEQISTNAWKNATDSRLHTLRQSFFFFKYLLEKMFDTLDYPTLRIHKKPSRQRCHAHAKAGDKNPSESKKKERMESMITTKGKREREKEGEQKIKKKGNLRLERERGRSEEKWGRARHKQQWGNILLAWKREKKTMEISFSKNRDRFPMRDEMKEILWSGKKGTPRELAAHYVFSKTNSEHLPFRAGGQSRSLRDRRNYHLSKNDPVMTSNWLAAKTMRDSCAMWPIQNLPRHLASFFLINSSPRGERGDASRTLPVLPLFHLRKARARSLTGFRKWRRWK